MNKTIEEIIKDAIRQGMQESSDEHLGNANIHRADLDGLIAQAQSLLSQGDPVALTKTIDELVNRFLRWKLPKGFSPDGGISFKYVPDFPELNKWEYWKPVGKNLFSAEQAKAMFEYLLADEQAILSQGEPVGYAVWNEIAKEWDLDSSIKNHNAMGHVDNAKILTVYLAPPAELFGKVEQLKIEKAELIEYAKWLAKHLTIIKNSINSNDYHKMLSNTAMASLAKEALDNPQPKCMGNK